MNDIIDLEILFDKQVIEILLLVGSISLILLIHLINYKNTQKLINKVQEDLSEIKKHAEVHGTYLSQFNDHFSIIVRKLKTVEDVTSVTSRDIASMAEGISGEVGVGKAIELARRGASVEEILQNSNLRQDQAELIVKFHGG